MKIATWNVNSLRARLELVLDWVRQEGPDVLCMQETKVTDQEFPREEFQRLGYATAFTGQKTYNGVAIATRRPISAVHVGFQAAEPEDECRLIAIQTAGVWVYSCYVPNGRSLESEQFSQKLRWLSRLRDTLAERHEPKLPLAVCGDFNVAADARDLFDVKAFEGKTHFHPLEHERLQRLRDFGLVDAFRIHHTEAGRYSWWDYRAGAFRRNLGMRIDYVWVTAPLAERCVAVEIDVAERRKAKPSDHAPVVASFRDAL